MKCDIGSNRLSAPLLVLGAAHSVTSGSGWSQTDPADNNGLGVTNDFYKMRQESQSPAVHIDEPGIETE